MKLLKVEKFKGSAKEYINKHIMKKTIERRNFYLSKTLLGHGYLVRVVNQNFEYNHDDVFNRNKKRFLERGSAHRSWSVYECYTKTSGFPKWASDYISVIK
jgi:hypothetical protein